MRRDIRDLKSSNARILGMIGEMVKAHATVDDRFNALEARVERLRSINSLNPSRISKTVFFETTTVDPKATFGAIVQGQCEGACK
jgi:hypothetical protein